MGVVHSQRLSCSRSPSHSRDHNSSNHSYTGLYVLLHKIYTYGCLVLTLSSPLLLSSFLPLPNFHLWFPDRLKPSSRATPRATRSPSPPWGTLPIPCTFLYIPNVYIEPPGPLGHTVPPGYQGGRYPHPYACPSSSQVIVARLSRVDNTSSYEISSECPQRSFMILTSSDCNSPPSKGSLSL